jgi:hypothetical protein
MDRRLASSLMIAHVSTQQRFLNLLPDWFVVVARHRRIHGAFPNIIRPATFNEKIVHRILFDRRPLLTQLADKAEARSYVESRLGPEILPKLHSLTANPDTIPFDALPDKFVVKPTHASGLVRIITDKRSLNRAELIETCNHWLGQSLYQITREWPYKNVKPQIIIEEFIDDGMQGSPIDYKFFVFDGVVEFIQVDVDRFRGHRRRLFTPTWQKLAVRYQYEDITSNVSAPIHLDKMIAAAEKLGRDLDFIRADFYDTPRRTYFGELTTTPECAMGIFDPIDFDRYLGSKWTLPPKWSFRRRTVP